MAAIGDGELPPSALPAVSFLKAPGYEDGHPGYSDPADEQAFVTQEIDSLMRIAGLAQHGRDRQLGRLGRLV